MNKNNLHHLSPVMCLALLLVTLLGLDFLIAPYDAAQICGSSSYWAVFSAFLFVIPLLLLIWGIQQRFPDKNLLGAGRLTLGSFLGTCGSLLYLGIFLFQIIVIQRHAIEFVSTYLLDRTPIWVTYTFVLIGVDYIAINGFSAVSCLAAFVVIPTIFFRLGLNLIAFQGFNINNLLPVFTAPLGNYFRAGLTVADVFVPLGSLLLIYPYLTKPKKLNLISWSSAGGATLIMLLNVVGTIGVFGADLTKTLIWPIFELVRRVSLTYFVLDQVGLLLVIVWFTMFFVASTFYLNFLGEGIKILFPKFNYKWIMIGIFVLLEIGGLSFPDLQANMAVFTFVRQWILIPVTFYPLIIYLVALVRGIQGKTNAE